MNVVMRSVGVLVTLGLIALSVMMNFRFGQSLGRTEWDGLVYGLASACADGFKVILPFAIMAAWSSGRRFAASAGAALWLVFTAYSLASSLGHSAVNRAQTAGERRHQVEGYADLRRTIEMRLKEREVLPPFRSLGGLSAQREAAMKHFRFERTRGCTEVSRVDQSLCDELTRLEIEIATATRAAELDAELERLRQRLHRTSDVARSGESDAQTMILREMSGLAENYVRLGLTVLVSLMVELGSGLGMYVVVGRTSAGVHGPDAVERRRRPVTALRRVFTASSEQGWRRARIVRDDLGHESEIDLYRDYCLWVVQQNCGPALTLGDFRTWAEREALGEMVRKRGRNYYLGVKLASGRREPLRLAASRNAADPAVTRAGD